MCAYDRFQEQLAGSWKGMPISDMFTMTTLHDRGILAFKCRQCPYVNNRRNHACNHYDRIHVNNGKAMPMKRKYAILDDGREAEKKDICTWAKKTKVLVVKKDKKMDKTTTTTMTTPNYPDAMATAMIEPPSWWWSDSTVTTEVAGSSSPSQITSSSSWSDDDQECAYEENAWTMEMPKTTGEFFDRMDNIIDMGVRDLGISESSAFESSWEPDQFRDLPRVNQGVVFRVVSPAKPDLMESTNRIMTRNSPGIAHTPAKNPEKKRKRGTWCAVPGAGMATRLDVGKCISVKTTAGSGLVIKVGNETSESNVNLSRIRSKNVKIGPRLVDGVPGMCPEFALNQIG